MSNSSSQQSEDKYHNPSGNYAEIYTECQQALSELTSLLSYIAAKSNSEGSIPERDQAIGSDISGIQERLSRAESLLPYYPEKDNVFW